MYVKRWANKFLQKWKILILIFPYKNKYREMRSCWRTTARRRAAADTQKAREMHGSVGVNSVKSKRVTVYKIARYYNC